MNKIFSKVWNKALGCMVVASELAKGGGSARVQGAGFLPGPRSTTLAAALLAILGMAGALPAPAFAQEVASWVLTDGSNAADIGPGDEVRVTGGRNITVRQTASDDDAVLEVALDPDLVVESVTAGTTVLDANGVRVGSAVALDANGLVITGGPSVTASGIDAGGRSISNVADGTADGDAVNFGQLQAVSNAASAGWTVSDGTSAANIGPGGAVSFSGDGNIGVSQVGTDGSGEIVIALERDLDVDSVAAGDDVTLDSSGLTIAGGPSVTATGIDAGGTKITNLANGEISETSTDAVTGQQVHDLFFEGGTAFGVRYFRANSTAPDSIAEGDQSIAIGPGTVSAGDNSFAAGDGAETTEDAEGAIALGQGATAGGEVGGAGSIAVGRSSEASGTSAVALGDGAEASAGNATALGAGALASGNAGIAIGQAQATGDNSLAAGSGAFAGSPGGIALGTGAGVDTHGTAAGDKTHHIAIGSYAGQNVEGNQTTAIGYWAGSNVTGDHNVAVGSHAGEGLQGDFNVAIGHEANRGAGQVERATAIGGQSDAGRNAVAVGYGAAAGDSGVALGANTAASNLGVALGRNSSADGGNVALGSASAARSTDAEGAGYLTGSSFTDGTVVSVGNTNPGGVRTTRRIVNVADGSQGYDAVNVRQLQGAQQAVANLVGGNVTVEDGGAFGGYVIELQDSDGQSHQYRTVSDAINAVSSGAISVLPGDAVIRNPNGTVTVAEGVLGDDAVNVDQLNQAIAENGTKYFSVNSSEPANRDNANASGSNAMAIGPAASADGRSSLAAGHLAHTVGNRSVALGYEVEALGNDSTAIGSGSDAYGDGAVAVGLRAKSQGENSIVMGTDAQADPKNTDATVDNAIVIGTRAEASADNGIAIGESALASELRAVAQGFDAHATADDALAFGSNSRASAESAQASGTNASASGVNAQASGTNARASGYDAIATGTEATGYATNGIAMGTGAVSGFHDPLNQDPRRNTGGIAIGNDALADNHHALALGVDANARAESATAIGDASEATAEDAMAVGSGARATAQSASAFGQGTEAVAAGSLAAGSGARAAAQNASALGQGAQALHAGSVALGSGAVTTTAHGTASTTIDKVTYNYAGTAPVATVSLGDGGAERTITNLAAGRVSATSTDAINGSQLFGTNKALEALAGNLDTAGQSVAGVLGGNANYDPGNHQVTMSNVGGTGENTVDDAIRYAAQGWDVSANGSAANVAPGGSVDFSNTDDNIQISRNGTDLVFDLADNLVIDNSIEVGDTYIDGDSITTTNLTVGGDTHLGDSFAVNRGGVYYDGPITEGDHIVNKTYVDGAVDELAVTPMGFAGDTGTSVQRELGQTVNLVGGVANAASLTDGNIGVVANGSDTLEIRLSKDLNLGADGSVAIGDATVNNDGLVVDDSAGNATTVAAGTVTVTANPVTGPANTIIIDANTGTIGGLTNTTFDPDDYTSGQAATEDQLRQVSDAANAGWNVSVDGEGAVADNNIGPGGTVDFSNTDGNIQISRDGSDLAFELADDIKVDSVEAGDTVVNTDGVRVGDDVALDETGLVIAGGPSVTIDGINAGGLVITNVAAGAVNATSTDAVNGSQLYRVADNVANIVGGETVIDPTTGAVTTVNIGNTGEDNIHDAIEAVNTAANAGWNVTDADGNAANIGPNGEVAFVGDGNIAVAQTGDDGKGAVEITLNRELDVDSLTAGNTVVDNGGVTVSVATGSTTVGAGFVSVTGAGGTVMIDGNQGTIGGLTNTTFDPDNYTSGQAATEDQLAQVSDVANAGWNVSVDGEGAVADNNIGPGGTVDFSNTDGNIQISRDGSDLAFELADDIEVDSVTAGDTVVDTDGVRVGDDVTLDDTGLVIAGGPSVTIDGINAGGLVITNVAAGAVNATSTDAVNGSQLYGVADSVSTIIGGNAVVNPDGSLTTSDIGGTGYDTIDEAIRSANDAANAGWTATDGNGNAANIGPNGTVGFTGDGNIAVNQTGTNGNGAIEVTLNRDLDVDSIRAGDTVVDTDGVRVGDDVRLDGTGLVIEGGPSVTVDGIDAGGQVVSNVAAGVEDTDAANVGQLKDGIANAIEESNAYTDGRIDEVNTAVTNLGDRMTDAEGDIANLDGRVTTVEGDVGGLQAGAAGPFQVSQDAPLVAPAPTGANSAAGGSGAEASGGNAVALGNQAIASGENSTAVGQGAKATHDNSVALGQGSATTVGAQSGYDAAYVGSSSSSGEVNVGNRTISGVAPGMAGNDAVNVNQLNAGVRHAVVTANDYTDQRFNQVQDDMWHLNNRVDGLERDINAGIATAMAMRQAPYVAGATTYYAGVGAYKGEGALGVSLRRTADNGRWSLEGGFSANNEGTGGYVGVSGVIGGK